MKVVEMTKTFVLNGAKYEAGHRYIMDETTESMLRSLQGSNVGITFPIESVYRPYRGEDLSGKKFMAWRMGGIGDLSFINPCIRYLKKKYPTCSIRFASGNKQPLENLPEIDQLYNMPFDAELLKDADYHLMFQGIIEGMSEDSKNNHAVDMFLKYFSIDPATVPPEEKIPHFVFTDDEMVWLSKTLPMLGILSKNYVVGIQLESSSPIRNFPNNKIKAVIDVLAREENIKIVLIGTEAQEPMANFYKNGNPSIILATRFSVRQAIILANRYDLVLAPDSFMIQIAGGLRKPVVGLYGPFPSWARMKYFKNAVGLDPVVKCSPCYKHDFRSCIKAAPGFPSPCFSLTNVDDVLQALDYLKNKTTGSHFAFMGIGDIDLSEVEKYMMSADKGISFFGEHFSHTNVIKVDNSPYYKADIKDLNSEFKRNYYPFVMYFGPSGFMPKNKQYYNGCKTMVREGGYFIVYSPKTNEAFYNDVKKDLEKDFSIIYEKLDNIKNITLIVAKKGY